jgi:tryptophan 2,3-dioxygenase
MSRQSIQYTIGLSIVNEPPTTAEFPMSLTYTEYLQLDHLLRLQQPLSKGPEHDEMLFIIIHQVYELWFKQVLHELDYLVLQLQENRTPQTMHTLKRILKIFKTLVSQLDILETMTPLEFLTFRERLETASGFQSSQFRELEFALGLKSPARLDQIPAGSEAASRLERRLVRPSLWQAFLEYLAKNDYPVPREQLDRDPRLSTAPSGEVQKILIQVYRENPQIAAICEGLVDFDEGFQEWRYRHVKMVERTIGTKFGTGGSEGVAYLKETLFKPAFPDLWAIRTEL